MVANALLSLIVENLSDQGLHIICYLPLLESCALFLHSTIEVAAVRSIEQQTNEPFMFDLIYGLNAAYFNSHVLFVHSLYISYNAPNIEMPVLNLRLLKNHSTAGQL